MWCPVLPPPAPAGRAGLAGRAALGWAQRPQVRRSRGRWPAGLAADGGRRPGSDSAGAERRTVGPRKALLLEDCFLSLCLCLVPSEYNILQYSTPSLA